MLKQSDSFKTIIEKKIFIYKGLPITVRARSQSNIFQVLGEKNCQCRAIYPAKLSSRVSVK